MSIVSPATLGAAVLAGVLCLVAGAAPAQVAPVQYWVPSGLFGFGGSWSGAGVVSYQNFPSFDATAGYGDWAANVPTGAFMRSEAASFDRMGLGWTGNVSDFGALSIQSSTAGYAFKGAGNLPVTVYAGFDTLDYRPGIGTPLAPFSSDTSIAAGYRARAGIAFQPTPNLSLSFEAGITQQQTDGDTTSRLLSGQAPFTGLRR